MECEVRFVDVRKINCRLQSAEVAFTTSDFSEHPKNKGHFKPHTLVWGALCFFDEKLKEAFDKLKEKDSEFYKELGRAFSEICKNAFCGRNVKKNLIPKSYVQKYNLNNLWIYNLREGWRLIYFITTPDKIEVLAVILEWMSHKDYERMFGF